MIVQEAFAVQTDRWNELLFALCDLAKPGENYDGENSEELLALISKRLAAPRL